jgi:NAD(P)-dependent dehydrogenase (short-subunit alcohol dehydrogenase family)
MLVAGLWAIVNNAGIMGPAGPAEMCTRQDFLAPLQVNLLGMTQVTRHFLRLVRKEKGRIVNTVSVAGKVAIGPCPYVASKFAAMGYSDMLR